MFRRYIELSKPERTLANVITALAGYLFASKWHIDATVLYALLVGSSLIIASACVFNNYIDRDLDKKMARTRKRALVAGTIAPAPAFGYGIALGALGFWLLTLTNGLTVIIGAIAFLSYVVLYDIAKRTTPHGTLVGTIPGAASLVAGYTAVTDKLDTTALLLFLIMVTWQMAHFYAIAIYRYEDYKTAKVPVWPVTYGIKSAKKQILYWVLAFIVVNILLSVLGDTNYLYAIIVSLLGIEWLRRVQQGLAKQTDDTKWAHGIFGFSLTVLLGTMAVLALV